MYLSIGNDMAVRDSSVIGIFDMDNTSTSKRTRDFLAKAQKDGLVVPCDDLPKSYVLAVEYGMDKVYLSKVFSYTPDFQYHINADEIIKGGSGYCIRLENGKEIYIKSINNFYQLQLSVPV